jgi:hypothetical protein
MNKDAYEIRTYAPDMMPQVVDVMSFLWGKTQKSRQEYFQWKYNDNPNTEFPLGIMALYKGQVVGFRGYFATRFEIPNKTRNLIVLVSGDTCIHPDHRRKGLSILMSNLAIDNFSGTYKIFLNMTSTPPSLPGYLRMSFQSLTKKAYMSHYSFPGFIKYLINYKKRLRLEKHKVILGIFDHVVISDHPQPDEMAAICARETSQRQRIRLLKDRTFFQWRFENPMQQYIFYYFRKSTEITGYVVIRLSPNCRRGYILDFAESDSESVIALLRYIIQNKHFDILSVYHFSLSDEFRNKLRDLGFKTSGLVRRLEQKKTGELPVLIRPVRKRYTENDWKIEGLDIRKIDNWEMPEICSDFV